MRLIPYAGYVSVFRRTSLSAQQTHGDMVIYEAADNRLLASGRLNELEKRLVERHRFTVRSRILWMDFMAALKSRKPFRALAIMLRDPRQAPYILRGLGQIFVRRVTGAKKKP
jgi:hypothetical protein